MSRFTYPPHRGPLLDRRDDVLRLLQTRVRGGVIGRRRDDRNGAVPRGPCGLLAQRAEAARGRIEDGAIVRHEVGAQVQTTRPIARHSHEQIRR
jgi:hypothetical protein